MTNHAAPNTSNSGEAGSASCKTMGGQRLFDDTHVNLTLHLRIYDVQAFRAAACERAIKDGMSVDDAAAYLIDDEEDEDGGGRSLGDCAAMLFDTGSGPAGCDILDTTSETF